MEHYTTIRGDSHDPLTGLLAAPLFLSQSQRAARNACRRGVPLSVISVSFDPADAADWTAVQSPDLLSGAARYLRSALRAEYFFTRSGDAFTIVMPAATAAEAKAFARLLVSGRPTLQLSDSAVDVAAYAGTATIEPWRDPIADISNALEGSLTALNLAWRGGPSSVVVYTAGMGRSERRLSQIVRDFPLAIPDGQLTLLYQPIVEVGTQRITAVEALVRWRHPQLHVVGPLEFVPVAERLGYAETLDEWVLTRALEDFAAMHEVAPDLCIHVNMCPIHLSKQSAGAEILTWVREAGIPPQSIMLEITESAGERSDGLVASIAELRYGGVKIAVDDIGSGFNTLLFFAEIPCDAVKVDRALVPCEASDARRDVIFSALRDACARLDVAVIAEGVETRRQHEFLERSGLQYAQGYFYGFPMPASHLRQRLQSGTAPEPVKIGLR